MTAPGGKVDWPEEAHYGPAASLKSEYTRGYREGYAAALQDVANRKTMQREVIDQVLVQRFAEILADQRKRAG